MDDSSCKMYLAILKEELVPALGCTEPIAIAYAAAKAREVLGAFPKQISVFCSGNIIKNVKSVVVPNTGGLKGIEVSALAGAVGGNAAYGMEVLSCLQETHRQKIAQLLQENICRVLPLTTGRTLHILVEALTGRDTVTVEVQDFHTNIVAIIKNGQAVYTQTETAQHMAALTDRSVLNVADILAYANTVSLAGVKPLLEQQIANNMAIAREGLNGRYGVDIGNTLLYSGKDSVFNKMKAYTAAASEARMGGCELPVITNSGSGNQGIASSVPVIVYAEENGIAYDRLLRALVLSNLLTIHQKTFIGRLSAFCGVVSASCASGAAITYLAGGTLEQVKMTITNTLANVSGIVCDGAKPSCGIKVAASLDAAIMAHLLAMHNRAYLPGDGLVKTDVEDTISSVGRMARDGMKETDAQILEIMLEC